MMPGGQAVPLLEGYPRIWQDLEKGRPGLFQRGSREKVFFNSLLARTLRQESGSGVKPAKQVGRSPEEAPSRSRTRRVTRGGKESENIPPAHDTDRLPLAAQDG